MRTLVKTINFKYCCATSFKRVYSKYMRSLKKQYGRVLYAQMSIVGYEKEEGMVSTCRYCPNHLKTKFKHRSSSTKLHSFHIEVKIPNE